MVIKVKNNQINDTVGHFVQKECLNIFSMREEEKRKKICMNKRHLTNCPSDHEFTDKHDEVGHFVQDERA